MKKYLTSSITIVFYIMIFVATTQTSVLAIPTVDGFLGLNEYVNEKPYSFTAGWYNGHDKNSAFPKVGGQTTTGYYYWDSENENKNFYLYLAAPLEAKNMVWGSGFTADEAALYGTTDGSFKKMIGSEKLVIGGTGGKKDKKDKNEGITADLNYSPDGSTDTINTPWGEAVYKDSVDYVINNMGMGYDTTNSSASNIPMAFEFMFAGFEQSDINDLILYIQGNELGFHLSPERGGTLPGPDPVPEPATILLFGLGLLGLAGVSRKKQ